MLRKITVHNFLAASLLKLPIIFKLIHCHCSADSYIIFIALAKDIRESNTLGEFKSKLLKKIRPVKKPLYEICDTRGVRCLTKLRVRFSPLGEHKFRHNFESLSPICTCNTGIEDNEHFLLHCPLYDQMRNDLFDQLSEIPGLELDNLNSEALCELLLFGNLRFNNIANKLILEAIISFILSTGRLE